MNSTRRMIALAALAPLMALAACNDAKSPDDKRAAGGEVLPGSISDAMLPVDTVRSQPPLAPRTDAASAQSADEKSADGKPADDKAAAPAAGASAPAADRPAEVPKPDAT
jgi:hypothetical protein